jgi:autotransporter passenger strand-loop-strand repeat protein
LSGGVDSETVISAHGTEYVYLGGLASATTVDSGGILFVDGGTAGSSVIVSGGLELVLSGGLAIAATVDNGGELIVLPGGSATALNVAGGLAVTAGVVVLQGNTVISAANGTVSGASAGFGQIEYVESVVSPSVRYSPAASKAFIPAARPATRSSAAAPRPCPPGAPRHSR